MALEEQYGSRSVEVSKGMAAIGKRIFIGDWATAWDEAPRLNDPYPGIASLLVTHISVTPYGRNKTGKLGDEYVKAKVEVDYSTPEWNEMFPRESIDISAEVLEVGRGRTWASDSKAVDQPLNIVYPSVERTVERTVYSLPVNLIASLVGKLNDEPINYVTGVSPDRGKILFLGAQSRTEFDSEIWNYKYRLTMKFLHRALDHNYVWRQDTGAYDYTNPPVYEYADLSVLGSIT